MRGQGGEGVEAEQRSSADLLLVDDPEEAEEEIGFNDIRMIFDDDDEDDFGKEEEQKEEEVQVEEDVQKEEQVEKEEEEEKEEQVEKEDEVEVDEEGNPSRDVDLEEVELSNNPDFLLFDELNEQRYFCFKAFSVLELYCPIHCLFKLTNSILPLHVIMIRIYFLCILQPTLSSLYKEHRSG